MTNVVVEQGGMIHRFDVDAQVMSTVVMLGISSQVIFSGAQGSGASQHPSWFSSPLAALPSSFFNYSS